MNRMKLLAVAAGLAVLTGCAAGTSSQSSAGGDEAELSASLAGATFGRVPGQPVDCVEVSQLTANRALGPSLLLFEGQEGRLYANRTQSCQGLAYGHSVRLKTVTARLCSGNAVDIVDSRGARVPGNCTIGRFLTYTPRP
jgi:hypothetical protein